VSQQVLHLDFIRLTPETGAEQRTALATAAAQLSVLEGVIGVGVIEADTESDFDLAFWFLLRDFAALEPFGTDTRYSAFLQRSAAPLLTAFAGADVKLEEDFEASEGPATCLALVGPEESYDFEVREALETWSEEAATAAVGLAVGERQIYRGAAIAFGESQGELPPAETFRSTIIQGQARTLA
jgi:hypothetical protein